VKKSHRLDYLVEFDFITFVGSFLALEACKHLNHEECKVLATYAVHRVFNLDWLKREFFERASEVHKLI
jgi:hypothetical protein